MIEGRNILVYIQVNGQFVATACDKSCTLHIQIDFLEITDPNDGRIKRRLPTYVDWSLSGQGLVDYTRLVSVLFAQQSLLAGARIMIRFYANDENGYALYTGYGYFQTVDEVGAVNDVATYAYTIVGDSELTISSTVPQDQNENMLYSVLANADGSLILNSDNNLIIN